MFSDLLVTKRIFARDTYNYESWNFPNVGYYCPADGLQTAEIPPYHCTLHCLQMPDWVTLNYNKIAGLCTLLPAPCTLAFRREGMEYLMFNGRTHDPCVKWVPYPGSDLSSLRAVKSPKGEWACRLNVNNAVLLGSFVPKFQKCYVSDGINNGVSHYTEIQTISPECTVGWVNYTAGTSLPPTAVVAGRSITGDNLYVAMITLMDYHHTLWGYYNDGMGLGYCTYISPHTAVFMDLMVLL